MRSLRFLPLSTLLLANLTYSEPPKVVTDFGVGPQVLLSMSPDQLKTAEKLSVEELTEDDRTPVLSRIRDLPKLDTLKFYDSDLLKVDENDPVPRKVNAVLLQNCRMSQGTIRWLAKFPAGTELALVTCDTRALQLDLGKFKWVSLDGCELSRAAVTKLVQDTTRVTFKECTLTDDK